MTDTAALETKKSALIDQMMDLPSESLYRAAVIQLVGNVGEMASAFDRIATALERIAQVQEDEAT